jgi:hypothetical protein
MAHCEYTEGDSIVIRAEVIDEQIPQDVCLYYCSAKYRNRYHKIPMNCLDGYVFEATIPSDQMQEGLYRYCITVTSDNKSLTYPGAIRNVPQDWDFYAPNQWQFSVVGKKSPLCLLNPEKDIEYLSFTRIGDGWRQGVYDVLPAADEGKTAIRLFLPFTIDKSLDDYTMSVPVKEKIQARRTASGNAKGIVLRMRGDLKGQSAYVTLVESDGTSWSAKIEVTENWQQQAIPLDKLQVSKGVLLPLGFPERWNYWVGPAAGRGNTGDRINTGQVESIQISLRPSGNQIPAKDPWLDVSTFNITFE